MQQQQQVNEAVGLGSTSVIGGGETLESNKLAFDMARNVSLGMHTTSITFFTLLATLD